MTRCPRCRGAAWERGGDVECLKCGTIHVPTITLAEAQRENDPLPGRNIVRIAVMARFTPGGYGDGCEHARTCLACPLAECVKEWEPAGVRRGYAPKTVCSVEGCGRPHGAKGYCKRHYMNWRNSGTPQPREAKAGCSVEGCNEKHRANGLCNRHYIAAYRRAVRVTPEGQRVCSIQDCGQPHHALGYCKGHHRRLARTGSPLGSIPRRERGVCSVEGCGRPHRAWGLCNRHYQARKRLDARAATP